MTKQDAGSEVADPMRTRHAEAGGARARAEIILALDVPTLTAAKQLLSRVGASADFVKVGLELFTAEGPRVVEWLRAEGKRVFLDLKLHDIPNTVRGAAASAAAHGVSLLTVHGYGGRGMIEAAVEGAGGASTQRGEGMGILAVTVLTSFDGAQLGAALGRAEVSVAEEVLRLSGEAQSAGAHGIVCSGLEVGAVSQAYPALAPLVPGIRLAGGDAHDQARVVTPERAAADGARYLILGRAVTAAEDPEAALDAIRQKVEGSRQM